MFISYDYQTVFKDKNGLLDLGFGYQINKNGTDFRTYIKPGISLYRWEELWPTWSPELNIFSSYKLGKFWQYDVLIIGEGGVNSLYNKQLNSKLGIRYGIGLEFLSYWANGARGYVQLASLENGSTFKENDLKVPQKTMVRFGTRIMLGK